MKSICWSLITAALLASDPAIAMRCGTKLIAKGDHQLKVQKLCGEPSYVQVRNVYRSGLPRSRHWDRTTDDATDDELLLHQRSLVEVVVEDWIYNFGPSKLIKQVRFENGVVVSINNRGHGYLE